MPASSYRLSALALLLFTAVLGGCDDAEPVIEQVVALEVTPASTAFGAVPVGLSVERRLVVRNNGTAAWNPPGPPRVTGRGFSWRSGCEASLGPGRACDVTVGFAPVAEGVADGLFSVQFADRDGTLLERTATLTGAGVPATVTVSPSTIDFGLLLVGTSQTQAIDIENTGLDDVAADVVVYADDPGGDGYRLLDGARTRVRLAGGARTSLGVTFRPTSTGPATAHVVVEICGDGCGPGVALKGVANAPRIEATPRAVDFGAVAVGAVAHQTVRLENAGDGVLQIIAVNLGGDDDDTTIDVEPLPVSLGAREGIDVVVTYVPTQGRAALAAVLQISSSDPASPAVVVPIAATTTGPGLRLIPEVAHFGRLAEGETRDLSLVLTSIGDAAVTVGAVEVEGAGFALVSVPPVRVLAPRESIQFFARATATSTTSSTNGSVGRVRVRAEGVIDHVAELAFLSGTTGCVPMPLSANVNLGSVQIRNGIAGAVVIDNLGDADCVLDAFVPGGSGFDFDADFQAVAGSAALIAPGGAGLVQFGFSASRPGTQTATVELQYLDVAAPLFVSAVARGVDGELSVSPGAVTFGPIGRLCGDVEGIAVLSNTGAVSLTITGLTTDPPNAPFLVETATLPFSMLPGSTSPVRLTGRTPRAPVGLITRATTTFTTSLGVTATLGLAIDVVSQGRVSERFTAAADVDAVDVLFVVDNSGSMADDQQLLADNFAAFFADALTGNAQDFHVGVTTTDILSARAARGALVGSPSIITNTTSNLENAFQQNVLVGVDGDGLELGLEAMRLAFEHPANAGFLRANAALSVIFISDEEDGGAFVTDPVLSRSPDEYIALLRALKAGSLDNAPILVSGVLTPGQADRYEAVIAAFNGGTLDITRTDWGRRLSELGFDTFSLSRSFGLQSDAVSTSIVVTVDGVVTRDFSWDPERRAVILDTSPGRGAQVVVSYTSGC